MSIRGLSFSLLLIFTLLRPGVAVADDTVNTVTIPDDIYEVYRLPMGTMHNVDSVDHVCYNLDQFKLLLKLDSDLRGATKTSLLLAEEARDYKLANSELKSIIAEEGKQISALKLDRARLYERWSTENRDKHKAENKPTLGSWFPWALSGVLGMTTTVLIIVVVAGAGA